MKRKQNNQIELEITDDEFMIPFDALHRNDDSIIGFLRKNGDSKHGVEQLGSIKKRDLKDMLPTLAPFLLRDAYFTVNGYKSQPTYNLKTTGLRGTWRKEKNLRYLNAVYADLDIGRGGEAGPRGLTVNEGTQLLIDLAYAPDRIPTWSMTAQSGRGLYAFWILRDEDDEDAPETFKSLKNFTETLALYKAVNRAIYKRLECLAADKICDGARVLRVPGTLHSVTGEKCIYKPAYDADGLITYTLRELAKAFGVPVMEKSLPRELREQWTRNKSDNPNPLKANGSKSLAAARARDLVTLEQWRGGWHKGHRRYCLRIYAQFLKAAGTGRAETDQAVEIMARNCNPPFPSDATDQPIRSIVNEVWLEPFAKLTQSNLVKWLQITPDEARELELEKLLPAEVADERAIPKGGLRIQEKSQRRAEILKIINERGILSTREFQTELTTRGFTASHMTINRDLISLGFQDDEARKKAGRKATDQMTLSDL
jgi:hypothetical protein